MAYKLEISDRASADIAQNLEYLVFEKKSKQAARIWINALKKEEDFLRSVPKSRPLVPEWEALGLELREAFCHSHRVVFQIDEEQATVYVLRIYHSSRKPLEKHDL